MRGHDTKREEVTKFQDKQHELNSISDRLKKDNSFLPSVADKMVFCIEISGTKMFFSFICQK